MNISIFDIFKIGIGPSSSHTVGPMKASLDFILKLKKQNKLEAIDKIKIHLYGSLALTKSGHGTDIALQLGFLGFTPETINPNKITEIINKIKNSNQINLNGEKLISFNSNFDIITHKKKTLPYHSNGLIIEAIDNKNKILFSEEYYSVGGGFIETKSEIVNKQKNKNKKNKKNNFKYEFYSWNDLYKICKKEKKEVWEIILENEKTLRNEEEINKNILNIYKIMRKGIINAIKREGVIEGGLNLKRRTNVIKNSIESNFKHPSNVFDNILLWGIAMGEENASYGRIVTSPTNGAAGVIPTVITYYRKYYNIKFLNIKKFFLTAGAIGILCKLNASISGAEGGCQAEIGTATAMAGAGLTAAMDGTNEQCENAAIIGLCHNLGLICDPIKGLVQIPCIERNAINALKAIGASRLALLERESIYLTLDQVILTLKESGDDMPTIYKETALGGLAKNASCGKCNNFSSECGFGE